MKWRRWCVFRPCLRRAAGQEEERWFRLIFGRGGNTARNPSRARLTQGAVPTLLFFSFKICVWQTSTPFPIIKTYRHRTSLSLALLTSHGFLFRKRSAAFMLQHRCRDHVNQIKCSYSLIYTALICAGIYVLDQHHGKSNKNHGHLS